MAKWPSRKKTFFAFIIIAALILFLFLSAQLVTYFNFLLGNDVLVRVSPSREYFSVLNGAETDISFKVDTLNNFFCEAKCSLKFEDLSNNITIGQEDVLLKPGSVISRVFGLKAPLNGQGAVAYRFDVKCTNEKKVFCPANNKITTRKVLIVLDHELTPVEKLLQKEVKEKITQLQSDIAELDAQTNALADVQDYLEPSSQSNELAVQATQLKNDVYENKIKLQKVFSNWNSSNYYELSDEVEIITASVSRTRNSLLSLNGSTMQFIERHNQISDKLESARAALLVISQLVTDDSTMATNISNAIGNYNSQLNSTILQQQLEERELFAATALADALKASNDIISDLRLRSVKKEAEIDIQTDLMCNVTGSCLSHPSPFNRSHQSSFDMNLTCERLNGLVFFISQVTANYSNTTLDENGTRLANDTISSIEGALKIQFVSQTDSVGINGLELQRMFTANQTKNASASIEKETLLAFLAKRPLQSCATLPASYPELNLHNISKINLAYTTSKKFESLSEPSPICCLKGICQQCCTSKSCTQDSSKYPIIFLHGHQVNAKLSVDYSLETFSAMQEALEKDGWLDAGAVSLYSSNEVPFGAWGKFSTPLTIKGSYYYDAIFEKGNLVYVPTSSENIDTYSIRLKDIIDTVQYRTGSPKVILIGHSMGGLVSRRYLQIFGTDKVSKLILLGTPNNGTEGNIEKLCDFVGASRECQDMSKGSVFLRKLNSGGLPNIPVYNIVGTGCDMGDQLGDGTILEKNAQLAGAQNFIVKGSCSYDIILHSRMLGPNDYPSVYEFVKKAIH